MIFIKVKAIESIETESAEVTPEYIKKPLKFKDSDVLQINIKFPRVKISPVDIYKKSSKKINDFYNTIAENFGKYCEKVLYRHAAFKFTAQEAAETKENGGFKPFGAVMTFEAAYNKHDFLCVYLDINIYAGKGRGNAVRTAHIWNLKGGELLPPGRFMKFNRRLKYKICGYISEIMQKQEQNGEEYYINSDISHVYRHLDMKNFYLSENGCTFFFPQNTVAPANNGIVSFEVERDALGAP